MSIDALHNLVTEGNLLGRNLAVQTGTPESTASAKALGQYAIWQTAMSEACSAARLADMDSDASVEGAETPGGGDSSFMSMLETLSLTHGVPLGAAGSGASTQWAAQRGYAAASADTSTVAGAQYLPAQGSCGTTATGAIADQAREAAKKVSEQTGIPADLVFAQWAFETGGFSNRGATQLNNLAGIRIPGRTEYRQFSSVDDFANYYSNLVSSKRYAQTTLARSPEAFAASLKRGGYYEASPVDYARGLRRWQGAFQDSEEE